MLGRYRNSQVNANPATMVLYKIDASAFIGRKVRIRFVDHASGNWGLFFIDSVKTYYANIEDVPANAVLANAI